MRIGRSFLKGFADRPYNFTPSCPQLLAGIQVLIFLGWFFYLKAGFPIKDVGNDKETKKGDSFS